MLQKKCVYQVTTINQPALRHLGTSHFWKVLYNKIPMGQIRWPIFLFFMYMLVLTEKTSIFPKSNMFWILVFSCPKMTLISIFTRMTLMLSWPWHLFQSRHRWPCQRRRTLPPVEDDLSTHLKHRWLFALLRRSTNLGWISLDQTAYSWHSLLCSSCIAPSKSRVHPLSFL